MSRPAPPPEARPVFQAEDLRLVGGAGLIYGPLNLAVGPGEIALVVCQDLEIIRRLMRCGQDFARPDSGRLSWWTGVAPQAGAADWVGYDFFRRIGHIDRQSQLLHQTSLLDNLQLFHIYAGHADGLAQSRRVLETLGLADYEETPAEDLPEPLRRRALYALTFNKNPRLLLLERPFQFLDRDFDLVWGLILSRVAAEGLAVVVFDRTRALYNPGAFQTVVAFTPGSPSL